MLNQNSYYFNLLLTYFDQGGNNIWWSTNKIRTTRPIAELLITGEATDTDCIEESCMPICSEIIEREEQSTEEIIGVQSLIYPTFYIEDKLIIELNNLYLLNTPNYLLDDCVDSTCIDEYGTWTKAIKTNKSVLIENETYYFIKANPDAYNYSYIYSISLIHEETGEEINLVKNTGLLLSKIEIDYSVPNGFNVCLTITKFNIEEIITTYRFVSNPLYLRSNFNTNIPWQPLNNNAEDILITILYLLNTDFEIEDKNRLILYKDKQSVLINLLLKTINNIAANNSYNHSYIKNSTTPSLYKYLKTENDEVIANLNINPAIFSTITHEEELESDLIIILITLISALLDNQLSEEYINRCILIDSISLKEMVLKVIALTEIYKKSKDIFILSKVTTTIKTIEKRFLLSNGQYIESLENPIQTTKSKVYGDLFNYYVYNETITPKRYIHSYINYIDNIDLYLVDSIESTPLEPIELLLLKLIDTSIKTCPAKSLTTTAINLSNTTTLTSQIFTSYLLFKKEIISTFKESIPKEFGWLSDKTPIQDEIIEAITKPIIDLYIHAKYIKDRIATKDALTYSYTDIFTNKKELLSLTFETDSLLIRDSLWPGVYSNSIDLEIKGYIDDYILDKIDNIKSMGIETQIVSSVDMPTIDNFDLCIDIVKLEDYRCQVDINGQLILLTDGQCDLAPPILAVLLQETGDPITQETTLDDNILLETNG